MIEDVFEKLFGDKEYISKVIVKLLFQVIIRLVPKVRNKMKEQLSSSC